MLGPVILIFGSFLAVSPGMDSFLCPKLLCVALGSFLCLCQRPRAGMVEVPGFRLFFVLSLLATLVTVIHAESPWQAFLGLYRSPTAGFLGAMACWLAYEAGSVTPVDRMWPLCIQGATISAVVALLQLFPVAPFHRFLPGGRAIGLIGSPPFLGCMMALALAFSASGYLPESLFIAAALIATRSKAAIMGGLIGVGVLLFFRAPGRKLGRWTWVALGSLFPLVFLILNRSASDSIRIYTWATAVKAFLQRPFVGWGPDNFLDAFMRLRGPGWIEAGGNPGMWQTASENAHNLVLNLLATQGLLGTFAHGLLALQVGYSLLQAARAGNSRATQLCGAYAAVLAYSMFNPVPFMAWCVLAFFLGALRL